VVAGRLFVKVVGPDLLLLAGRPCQLDI
jgi:hypothetical protein